MQQKIQIIPNKIKNDVIVDFLANKLIKITNDLKLPANEFNEIDNKIKLLENFIFNFDENKLNFNHTIPLSRNEILTTNNIYLKWETELEKNFYLKTMNKDYLFSDYPLYQRFIRLIKNEIRLLQTLNKPLKRILFIGSGSMPISALLLGRYLDTQIDCLDIDPTAVQNSIALIAKWKFTNINAYHQSCEEHELRCYDAVFIALLAKPKLEILNVLHKGINQECAVICRTSYGLRTLLYAPTLPSQFMQYQIKGKYLAQTPSDVISSLLLVK